LLGRNGRDGRVDEERRRYLVKVKVSDGSSRDVSDGTMDDE
jgi:hypothetical protein